MKPSFMDRYKVISFIAVVWSMSLVSWVVYRSFSETPPDIPTGTASTIVAIIGIFTTAVALYKWKEERRNVQSDTPNDPK